MSVLTGADRVQETAQSIGLTTPITLLGAAGLGLQSFAAAGLDGKIVPYVIEHATSGQWEVGEGVYTAAGTLLNRTTVFSNSLGTTALVNFALGLVEVWVDLPAEKTVMLDADSSHLTLPAGLSIAGALDGVTTLHASGATTLDSTLTVGTSLEPATDNAVPLGISSKRWSDIRAITATLSGLLSGAAATFSGLLTAAAGLTISAAQTLALAGALISGAPTWGSAQAITLSTAAQPAITSVGTLSGLTVTATITGSVSGNAATATNVAWSGVTSTPTTIGGYGITDAYTKTVSDGRFAAIAGPFPWADVSGTPTTLAGYGITDAAAGVAGVATSATKLATARAINGVAFDGTAAITITSATVHALTAGTHLAGGPFDGSAAVTLTTDAASLNTASTLVARDASGNFAAGTITAALTGNASTATNVAWSGITSTPTTLSGYGITDAAAGAGGVATSAAKLATARAINGVNFDGTAGITVTAAAGTLTGTTLNATVVTSSLTTIGTLVGGAVPASLVTAGTFGAGNFTFPANLVVDGQFTVNNGGGLQIDFAGITTAIGYLRAVSTGANMRLGVEGSVGGVVLTGTPSYAAVFGTENATAVVLGTNGAANLIISSGGAANFTGNFSVATSKFTVDASTGNTVATGSITAGTDIALNGTLTFTSSGGASPGTAAIFYDATAGMVINAKAGATYQFYLQNTTGGTLITSAIGTRQLVFGNDPGGTQDFRFGGTGTFGGALGASNLSGTNTGDQTTISGNAGTATKLATARAINGVNFDGTAGITVAAAAGTLTGTTLASGVTASSLTSFGTLAANLLFTDNTYDIGASGATRPRNYFGSGSGTFGGALTIGGALSGVTTLTASSYFSLSGNNGTATLSGNGQGSIGTQTASGLVLTGQGSVQDIRIINSAGDSVLLVGTGSRTVTLPGPGLSLSVSGNISSAGTVQFSHYGAGTATFDASGNISSVSDERHKTDIRSFTRGMEALLGLRPISYKFNDLSGLDTSNDYSGFSAQNVREYIPEAVSERADGMLSFSDRPVLAAVVNAMQDVHDRLTRLEQRAA